MLPAVTLRKLREVAYDIYSRYFTFATSVEGTLTANGALCRCLFVMPRDTATGHYLLAKLFGDTWRQVDARRIPIPLVGRYAKKLPPGIDFGVAVLPDRWIDRFSGLIDLVSPVFLRQSIDMTGDWSDIKGRFLETRKRGVFNKFVREQEFSVRLSRSDSDFEHYYRHMYLPHTRKQFGPAGSLYSFQYMRDKEFRTGSLLMVAANGVDLAGAVVEVEGDTVFFRTSGVLGGDEELVRRGVQTALYVAMLRYAKEQGARRLDLGLSRAFFGDGVYRHKRSWGAAVAVDPFEHWICFLDPDKSRNAESFLTQNPLIVRSPDGAGLSGWCIQAAEGSAGLGSPDRLVKDFHAPGLDGVVVCSPGGGGSSYFPFPACRNQRIS
jgi:hypothetical protein